MMRVARLVSMAIFGLVGGCHSAPTTPPTQIVYRFDDHRYLELTGFNCEGELWYSDVKRGIHSEVTSQFYRLFTKKYIHPSEKYIAITYHDASSFLISKDYGQTWDRARFSPGGGVDPNGASSPEREEIDSFTVVNDQGFILTKKGDIYLSSKPFDDPRFAPGGPGVDFRYTYKGQTKTNHFGPGEVGGKWGKEYVSLRALQDKRPEYMTVLSFKKNFQDLPQTVPEVKNYTGWDRMRCNPDLGLPPSEQGK